MSLCHWVTEGYGFHLATGLWSFLVLHTLRVRLGPWDKELRMPWPRSMGKQGCQPVGFEELDPAPSLGAREQSFSQESFLMVTSPCHVHWQPQRGAAV